MKKVLPITLVLALVAAVVFWRMGNRPVGTSENSQSNSANPPTGETDTILENLDTPWSIVFLPGGELLVTERPGSIVFVRGGEKTVISVPGVTETGEGGLMGLALHPDFSANNMIYAYFTAMVNGSLANRVLRYELVNFRLGAEREIISGIPAGQNHNGGRIAFGPDRLLYITAGDSGRADLAQDKNSLAGKILRLREDGTLPDNPFNNPVYSYGHRNPQGLAWDDQGRLWATEHGRSGARSGLDEINLIERGANYGWPEIEGDERQDGMKNPVVHSGQNTWAPSGLAFQNGKLYFAGLRGQALYEAEILGSGSLGEVNQSLAGLGRMRAVTAGPDGKLYVSTSNRDGRGTSRAGDDRIISLGV